MIPVVFFFAIVFTLFLLPFYVAGYLVVWILTTILDLLHLLLQNPHIPRTA
jgi:hypothetical protein